MFRSCYWFLLLLFAVVTAQAEPASFTDEARLLLSPQTTYLEDQEGTLEIDDLLASDLTWNSFDEDRFNRGFSRSAWWLRTRLENASPEPQSRVLEIGYPLLDNVQIFIVKNGTVQNHLTMGDKLPYADRPVNHHLFLLPLEFQPGETLDVYLRVRTSGSVQVPLALWQPDALSLNQADNNILQGLYYGAMLVIIIYNLLIFLILWDRSYLYYIGFVASMTLLMASLSGLGFRYVWPENTILNEYAVTVSASLIIIFANLFTARFLELRKRAPVMNLITLILAAMGVGALILSVTTSYSLSLYFLAPLALLSSIGNIAVGSINWWRGVTLARYYCIAWALFLIGCALLSLSKMTILPSNWFTDHAIQIGSVLEAVLLSFALAERINIERRLRLHAQEETIDTVRRLNSELEQRVEERTEELEALNQQLQKMSNTDQLTNIPNRRQLETRLNSLWRQCAGQHRSLAVILLDIDYFKYVNDHYGHLSGDECLQQIAAKISGCIHWDTDLLARYGGEEFCLLLPDVDSEKAMSVAQRIRSAVAGCKIVTSEHAFSVTISLGVCVTVPSVNVPTESVLKQADEALYESKENGRNRATLHKQTLVSFES